MIDLSHFNVTDYLDSKGIYYRSEGKNIQPGWVGIDCPFCIDQDRGQHLGISATGGISCWRCGARGNVYKLIKLLDEGKRPTAIIEKYSSKIIKLNRTIGKRTGLQSLEFPSDFGDLSENFKDFLMDRRYDPEIVIPKYKLQAGGFLGDFPYRLIVPFYSHEKLLTWIGRDITGGAEIPYLPLGIEKSVIHSSYLVYNIEFVRDVAIVVEGVFDAWRIGDGAASIQGLEFTIEQLQYFKRCKKMFVLMDAGKNEEKVAKNLGNELSSFVPDVEIIRLSEGDPDDLTEADVKSLRKDLLTTFY
jgi:hypothetical protein